MIETNILPVRLIVAARAARSQLALVRVFRSVTACARCRGGAELCTGFVAARTGDTLVTALQRIVRKGVVEGGGVEADQLSASSDMVGMATAAGGADNLAISAMEARARGNVRSNRLVTAKAETALSLLFERLMAGLAPRLKPRMRRSQGAG